MGPTPFPQLDRWNLHLQPQENGTGLNFFGRGGGGGILFWFRCRASNNCEMQHLGTLAVCFHRRTASRKVLGGCECWVGSITRATWRWEVMVVPNFYNKIFKHRHHFLRKQGGWGGGGRGGGQSICKTGPKIRTCSFLHLLLLLTECLSSLLCHCMTI